MHRFASILLSSLLVWYFALASGLCACFEPDDYRAQDSRAGQDPASLDASQQPGGVVTASLVDPHEDKDECNHTASGKAKSPEVAKRSKSPVHAVPALSCSASTQWPVPGDIEAPSIAGAGDYCGHHWLIFVRSVVLLL